MRLHYSQKNYRLIRLYTYHSITCRQFTELMRIFLKQVIYKTSSNLAEKEAFFRTNMLPYRTLTMISPQVMAQIEHIGNTERFAQIYDGQKSLFQPQEFCTRHGRESWVWSDTLSYADLSPYHQHHNELRNPIGLIMYCYNLKKLLIWPKPRRETILKIPTWRNLFVKTWLWLVMIKW